MLKSRLLRLPTPLLTPLPMIVTFLVGLGIWTIAFSIPVRYPQETMAPYPDSASIAVGSARSPTPAAAASVRQRQRAAQRPPSDAHSNS